MNKYQKASLILEYLSLGQSIVIDDYTWVLGENEGGTIDLCAVAINEATGEECLLSAHVSLGTFIKMADKLDDDEILTVCANMALNKLKRAIGRFN